MRPKAVMFSAVEMPLASSTDFCDGSAAETAANASITPMIVPSNPSSVATLARIGR